jgi:hypothetical protein
MIGQGKAAMPLNAAAKNDFTLIWGLTQLLKARSTDTIGFKVQLRAIEFEDQVTCRNV